MFLRKLLLIFVSVLLNVFLRIQALCAVFGVWVAWQWAQSFLIPHCDGLRWESGFPYVEVDLQFDRAVLSRRGGFLRIFLEVTSLRHCGVRRGIVSRSSVVTFWRICFHEASALGASFDQTRVSLQRRWLGEYGWSQGLVQDADFVLQSGHAGQCCVKQLRSIRCQDLYSTMLKVFENAEQMRSLAVFGAPACQLKILSIRA